MENLILPTISYSLFLVKTLLCKLLLSKNIDINGINIVFLFFF